MKDPQLVYGGLKHSYEEYECYYKYILVDDYISSPDNSLRELEFMTLDEILECLDERFVFNEESNNEWFENGVIPKENFDDYCKWSLKNRLNSYGYFNLYIRDPKNKTYVKTNSSYSEHTLGSKTYPKIKYHELNEEIKDESKRTRKTIQR
mgnify:CR=1 FL=1|tara:strand:- start:487 stop:939 length:453 start_codon:yes stop_codon:yes gene_type:complete